MMTESSDREHPPNGWAAPEAPAAAGSGHGINGSGKHAEPRHSTELAAEVRRLAALPPREYDRVRKVEADRLDVRLTTFGYEVKRARSLCDSGAAGSRRSLRPRGSGSQTATLRNGSLHARAFR
jgi:hypothetical protein